MVFQTSGWACHMPLRATLVAWCCELFVGRVCENGSFWTQLGQKSIITSRCVLFKRPRSSCSSSSILIMTRHHHRAWFHRFIRSAMDKFVILVESFCIVDVHSMMFNSSVCNRLNCIYISRLHKQTAHTHTYAHITYVPMVICNPSPSILNTPQKQW